MGSPHPAKTCRVCGAEYTVLGKHLKAAHPEMSAAQYRALCMEQRTTAEATAPGEPAVAHEPAVEKEAAPQMAAEAAGMAPIVEGGIVRPSLHELFHLGKHCREAMDASGNPIPVTVLLGHGHPELVPEINKGYVFDPEILKDVTLGLEFAIPIYLWGVRRFGAF